MPIAFEMTKHICRIFEIISKKKKVEAMEIEGQELKSVEK